MEDGTKVKFNFKIISSDYGYLIHISEIEHGWLVTIPFQCDSFGNNIKLLAPLSSKSNFNDEKIKNACRYFFRIWLKDFPDHFLKFQNIQKANKNPIKNIESFKAFDEDSYNTIVIYSNTKK